MNKSAWVALGWWVLITAVYFSNEPVNLYGISWVVLINGGSAGLLYIYLRIVTYVGKRIVGVIPKRTEA